MNVIDVGLDLDGCIQWFDRGYHAGCVAAGLLPASVVWQPPASWSFYEQYGHDAATFVANCHRLADLGLLWSGPLIAGARSMWHDLRAAGHRIHVKTDRGFGSHPAVSEALTRATLAAHGLRYDSITFTADKTAGPHVDVMLEDKLENYDALDAFGVQVYLINRAWNGPYPDGRRRVLTHDQFTAAVQALADGTTARPAVASGRKASS
ncbi:MAG TPA: hypothetical protein VGF17_09645 [Phytomonospora sp.]